MAGLYFLSWLELISLLHCLKSKPHDLIVLFVFSPKRVLIITLLLVQFYQRQGAKFFFFINQVTKRICPLHVHVRQHKNDDNYEKFF